MLITFISLIFIRPFISSLAYPSANLIYSLLIAVFLCSWAAYKKFGLSVIRSIKLPLGIFIISLLISFSFSYNKIASARELFNYAIYLLLFLCVASLPDKDKDRIISYITLAGFLISVVVIYQYFFGFRHTLNYIAQGNIQNAFALDYIMQKRAFFPFVTPNVLAGYLAMILMLAFRYRYKILALPIIFFALLLTKSIGAFISIFLTLLIYLFLIRTKNRKYMYIAGGLLLIVLTTISSRMATQKEQFQPIFSLAMRLSYWKETLGIIAQYPLTGIGLGNFNLIDSRYAHNSYLQIWAEMGILGLASFLWLIVSILKNGLKKLPLAAAISVFLISNFLDFSFFLPEVSLIWWVILASIYTS